MASSLKPICDLDWEVKVNEDTLEPSDFLRKEHQLSLLATLRISEHQLSFINIPGLELEDFTYSHTTTGHELKDQAVPEFLGSKDDFINGLFFNNIPVAKRFCLEELSHHGSIAWILKRMIDVGFDEIEECRKMGVAGSLGVLFSILRHMTQE